MSSRGALLKTAVLAGLIAGAVASIFHLALTEPVIERAIRLEEPRGRSSDASPAAPLVSRAVQQVGLVVGLLLYGAIWGLLFGVAYCLVERHVEAPTPGLRGPLTAGLVGWSVALFPFLKYPANPPGVGDPATVGQRQALYVGLVALSVVGVLLALGIRRTLVSVKAAPASERWGWPVALGIYALYLAAVYALMPATRDPVEVPIRLVWTFRGVSFAGLVLFWGVLAVAFAWLARRQARA